MAEPKKKLSKTRTHLRRSTYSVPGVAVTRCSNCHEPIQPHTVCPHCGYYRQQPMKVAKPKRIVTADTADTETTDKRG